MAYNQINNPFKKKVKAKGGGTKKVCLPKAKIASMSSSEKNSVVQAKQKAGRAGKYKNLVKVTLPVQVVVVA